jgi:hypothetical protein
MTVGKFILGIIIAAVGFLFVWKTEWLLQNFGRIGFAEDKLRLFGGSRLLYKALGTIVVIYGLMYATDLSDTFFSWFVNSVFGRNRA